MATTKAPKKAPTRKKAATRKATAKKAPARRSAKKEPANQAAHEPVVGDIKGEQKYKLKAMQLEFNAHDERVRRAIAPQLKKLIDRAKRNDRLWRSSADSQRTAINEFLAKEEKKLPEGYAIVSVDPIEGTYRAVYDPESVGQRL